LSDPRIAADTEAPPEVSPRKVAVILLCLTALALLLRVLRLGNTFQSNDNVELAARILYNPGYGWTFTEPYGALIGVLVKLAVGCISLVGVTVTEFWWKLPVALIGTLQVPLTHAFLKRLKASEMGALAGAALMAVLPLHVMQSRYLWGYEVLAVFFVTLSLMSLLKFFEDPTRRNGLVASLLTGLYLISHGYVMPFAICGVALLCLFPPKDADTSGVRFLSGVRLAVRRHVWVYPAAFSFSTAHCLVHALRKPTRPGIYLLDHGPGFLANIGWPLAVLLAAGLVLACMRWGRSRRSLLLVISGAAYLAPLFFLTPPGITVVRGYMLMGTYFLILAALLVLDEFSRDRHMLAVGAVSLCAVLTLWGAVETIFARDAAFDPTGVRIERGGIPPDCGSKAAGYLFRKHVPDDAQVLAIHRAVEPPNLYYYFGRDEFAFYDLNLGRLRDKFIAMHARADVVICEPGQADMVEAAGGFERAFTVSSEGEPRMLIYARPEVGLLAVSEGAEKLNRSYDEEFAPEVRPW